MKEQSSLKCKMRIVHASPPSKAILLTLFVFVLGSLLLNFAFSTSVANTLAPQEIKESKHLNVYRCLQCVFPGILILQTALCHVACQQPGCLADGKPDYTGRTLVALVLSVPSVCLATHCFSVGSLSCVLRSILVKTQPLGFQMKGTHLTQHHQKQVRSLSLTDSEQEWHHGWRP